MSDEAVHMLPVFTVRAFERLLWVVYSEMTFQMGFPSKLLGTNHTLKQHLCWHVNHLDVHLKNILILKMKILKMKILRTY